MTEIQGPPVACRHDARLLQEDLACICGTLSEIMTAWRRVMPWRPELPIGGLTALQDTARQLAADIAAAGRGPAPGSVRGDAVLGAQGSHRRRPGDDARARRR